jgi:hypothetical protein
MTRYLLTIYQPDGGPPPDAVMQEVARGLHALNEEIKAAGGWVFTGGLHAPSTATVVRLRDREVVITDGPYVEGKEHVGGFWIVKAPDLDVALGWARKAAEATTLPIEVRPFQDVPEY